MPGNIQIGNIPDELKSCKQWCCYTLVWSDKKQKYDKIPINAMTGHKAKSDDSATWCDYQTAINYATRGDIDGTGFMFDKASGIFGVDIDNCVDENGQFTPMAQEIIHIMQSYTEMSPSGQGVHILAKGNLPPVGRRKGNLEMYDSGRFFTVTGQYVPGTPLTIETRTNEIMDIHERYIAAKTKPTTVQSPTLMQANRPMDLSDNELINKIIASKQGVVFQELWRGDTSRYGGDESAADLALCNLLAFWTKKDCGHIDSLFRQSGLYRQKWDKRHFSDGRTYGFATIQKAVTDCVNVLGDARPPSNVVAISQSQTAATIPVEQRDPPDELIMLQLETAEDPMQRIQLFNEEVLPLLINLSEIERAPYVKRIAKALNVPPKIIKQTLMNNVTSRPGSWQAALKTDEDGKPCSSPLNIIIILKNDPKLKGKFSYDMTAGAAFKAKGLPWSARDDQYMGTQKKIMTDGDFKSLYNYFHNVYDICNTSVIENAFAEFCMSIQENPLLDYLNGLRWDRIPRLDTLLVDYFNAENTEYVRAVTRKTFTAMVRRAYQPGVKFDNCLIIKGPQGCGKSTFFNIIGGQWYTDGIQITNDPAKTYESHRGKWVCEMGELTSMRKTESERLKSFFSTQVDRYRPPYGKNVLEIPRMCVVVGTSNSDEFLKDVTGNRRFWPVKVMGGGCKSVFTDLARERDQILAEAKIIHESGEPIFLPPEIEVQAAAVQSEFVITDPWHDRISNYLEFKLPSNWDKLDEVQRKRYLERNLTKEAADVTGIKRERICIEIIFTECLNGKIEQLTPIISQRIRDIMSQLPEWVKSKNQLRIPGYGRYRGWERQAVSPVSLNY